MQSNQKWLVGGLVFAYVCGVMAFTPVKEWDRRFGGAGWDSVSSVKQTPDGGFIICGHSSSDIDLDGGKTEDSRGGRDFWILKLDSDGNREWDKVYGGADEDYAWKIRLTADGGYIVAGSSASGVDMGGGKTVAGRGGADVWILKLDASGNREWDNVYGGAGEDYASDIHQTPDGGYIVAGTSDSGVDVDGGKTEDSRGGYDFWILKLDSDGNREWDKVYGGANHDFALAICPASDGGYIVAGYSSSGVDEGGGKTAGNRGGIDFWILKLDDDGNRVWDKGYGGGQNDSAGDLHPTIDGGYVVSGTSFSGVDVDGGKTEDSRGQDDFWVVKLDSSGNREWDKSFGGAGRELNSRITQTSDGKYLIAGASDSGISGDRTVDNRGSFDRWVVQFLEGPNIIIQPQSAAVTAGSAVDFSVTVSGSQQFFYQWHKNGVPLAGAVLAEYSIAPAMVADAGNYHCVVSNSVGAVTSSVAVLAVSKATPVVTAWPTSSAITAGQKLSEANLTGGAASVAGNFEFAEPDTAPTAGIYRADVSFIPDDTANYQNVAGTVDVPVLSAAPTGVSASAGTYDYKVWVTWNAAAGATSYKLYRSALNDSGAASLLATTTANSHADTTAVAGQTHYYWVKAANAAGVSGFSAGANGWRGVMGPVVAVNGLVGDNVRITAATPLMITVELMNIPSAYLGVEVDYWVAAYAHGGSLWYYLSDAMAWTPFDGSLENIRPVYQGPLINLPPVKVAEGLRLGPGVYNIWFVVDYPMDGILHMTAGAHLLSQVTLTVE